MVDFGMIFVDNWVVGKEKGCYWLSNDIFRLVGTLRITDCAINLKSVLDIKTRGSIKTYPKKKV